MSAKASEVFFWPLAVERCHHHGCPDYLFRAVTEDGEWRTLGAKSVERGQFVLVGYADTEEGRRSVCKSARLDDAPPPFERAQFAQHEHRAS